MKFDEDIIGSDGVSIIKFDEEIMGSDGVSVVKFDERTWSLTIAF